MDRQRLHARLRRLPAARRPRRRPARAQAAVPDRARRSSPARRCSTVSPTSEGMLIGVARAAGPRRGADLARGAVDHLDDVRRGRRARQGARRLGGDRDRRLGRRPDPRRRPDAVLLVAVDLLRQRARRHRRLRALAAPRSRSRGTSTRTRSYDLAGAVTVTGGLMALVYAIVKAESAGWGSAKTIGFFVARGGAARGVRR